MISTIYFSDPHLLSLLSLHLQFTDHIGVVRLTLLQKGPDVLFNETLR